MKWLALILLLFVALPAGATDYLCVMVGGTLTSGPSTSGIGVFGWDPAFCYGDIRDALAQMTPGSQLWIDDGTYQTSISVRTALAGTPDAYTVIRARNPGQVTLRMDSFAVVHVRDTSYVEIMGIRVTLCGDLPFYVQNSAYVKMVRCCWSMKTGLTSMGAHHVLWEDCYAWGGPLRYPFQASKGAHHVIYRRCLVRWDYSNIAEPLACFASYTCDNIYYQNCVSVDGIDNRGVDHTYDGLKSFFTPNGSTDCHYVGCLSIAMTGAAGWWVEGPTAQGSLTDCVSWNHHTDAGDSSDTYKPYTFASTADFGSWDLLHCTFGKNDYGIHPMYFDRSNRESMRGCIIYGMELKDGEYAVSQNLDDGDWNLYFNNTGNRNRVGTIGESSVVADPKLLGMGVPTIAWGYLSEVGIGARVIYKIGRDGSLFGDEGWQENTGELLWPWPYEDQIKADCASFHMEPGEAYPGSPLMDGTRGFCGRWMSLSYYLLTGGGN